MNPLRNIRLVLVSPLYGGNVGSVCRAMKNMGLSHLAVAAPRPGCDEDEALTMACHARDIFRRRKEYPTLRAAVADCGLVVGTTARAGLYRAHVKSPRDWAGRLLAAAHQTPVALVFGPEDNGLSNDDLAACTQLIRIPTAPAYPSLNLSHAVIVCGYELYLAAGQYEAPAESSPEAPAAMRERMFSSWRETMLLIGFVKEEKADHMMLALRRILGRALLTVKDVKILVGLARQARWCGLELKKHRPEIPRAGSSPPAGKGRPRRAREPTSPS